MAAHCCMVSVVCQTLEGSQLLLILLGACHCQKKSSCQCSRLRGLLQFLCHDCSTAAERYLQHTAELLVWWMLVLKLKLRCRYWICAPDMRPVYMLEVDDFSGTCKARPQCVFCVQHVPRPSTVSIV